MSDGAKIKAARKAAGLSQVVLAQRLGLPQSVISDWERDRLDSWRAHADRIALALGKPRGYFAAPQTTALNVREIPVIGEVQAGVFREAVEIPEEERIMLPMVNLSGYNQLQLFGLKVIGPSMDLHYPDGSYVIVASAADTDVRDGDKVVVYRSQGELRETTIKQVEVEADGRIALVPKSTHPDFQERIYLSPDEQDGPEIAYVVIASYNMEKRPPPPIQWRKRKA